MILKNSNYVQLVKDIIKNNKKIIIYGAGMIGQIIVPYLIKYYHLFEYVDCFIDADKKKIGKKIIIDHYFYSIKAPEYLYKKRNNIVILVTNSRFFSVISFLDQIKELNEIAVYLIPLLQIDKTQEIMSVPITKMFAVQKIPKKIHYCWFGEKPIPEFLQKCIRSWKENCPDYDIINWNEKNYDVNQHSYTKEAYKKKMYGFVSDFARLDILYHYGGIYFDTDVNVLRSLDDLLYQDAFVGVEKWGNINTGGGCGFTAGHPMLKEMIEYRKQFLFIEKDGSLNIETNGIYETIPFLNFGFFPNNSIQKICDVIIYPFYVFHPYDYISCMVQKREDTYSIHHFYGSWIEEKEQKNQENTQKEYLFILKRIEEGGYPKNYSKKE